MVSHLRLAGAAPPKQEAQCYKAGRAPVNHPLSAPKARSPCCATQLGVVTKDEPTGGNELAHPLIGEREHAIAQLASPPTFLGGAWLLGRAQLVCEGACLLDQCEVQVEACDSGTKGLGQTRDILERLHQHGRARGTSPRPSSRQSLRLRLELVNRDHGLAGRVEVDEETLRELEPLRRRVVGPVWYAPLEVQRAGCLRQAVQFVYDIAFPEQPLHISQPRLTVFRLPDLLCESSRGLCLANEHLNGCITVLH